MGRRHVAPPASLVLVHGAGSGPRAFEGWEESFVGTTVTAVDLQDRLDVALATAVAAVHGSELIAFPGLGHWDLVRSTEVPRAVASFLGTA